MARLLNQIWPMWNIFLIEDSSIWFKKCKGIYRIFLKFVKTYSLFRNIIVWVWTRTIIIIVRMKFAWKIDLKMQMVSSRVSGASYFPNFVSNINSVPFFNVYFWEMSIVWDDFLSRKSMFDRDVFSPSYIFPCFNDFSVSNRIDWSPFCSCDICSLMSSTSNIPTIFIAWSP